MLEKFPLDNELQKNVQVLNVSDRMRMSADMVLFFAKISTFIKEDQYEALRVEFLKYKTELIDSSIIDRKMSANNGEPLPRLEMQLGRSSILCFQF